VRNYLVLLRKIEHSSISAGDGDDTIAVRSLDNVDGSVYDGGVGNDKLTVYGTNDLSNTTLVSIETLELLPGSPSKVTMKVSQVAKLTSVVGSSGNSELEIVSENANAEIAIGKTYVENGGTADTIAFTYNGNALTATLAAGANTLSGLQAAIDASLVANGDTAGDVVASFSDDGATLVLAVATFGDTLTAVSYTDGTAGVATTTVSDGVTIDMTGVTFDGLQKLSTAANVDASLTLAQLANIAEVLIVTEN